jgi:hypothetical protein
MIREKSLSTIFTHDSRNQKSAQIPATYTTLHCNHNLRFSFQQTHFEAQEAVPDEEERHQSASSKKGGGLQGDMIVPLPPSSGRTTAVREE